MCNSNLRVWKQGKCPCAVVLRGSLSSARTMRALRQVILQYDTTSDNRVGTEDYLILFIILKYELDNPHGRIVARGRDGFARRHIGMRWGFPYTHLISEFIQYDKTQFCSSRICKDYAA
jgi:hypothetical protein